MTDRRTVRMAIAGVQVGSGLVWVWSWYTMYLEIFRWKHVTASLRFDPGPPIPGTTMRAKPGRPLKALYVVLRRTSGVSDDDFASQRTRPGPSSLGRARPAERTWSGPDDQK